MDDLRPEAMVPLLPRLRRHARLLTGQAARADDLVQDTVERACRKWALFTPRGEMPAALLAWLLTLMHHLYLNGLRDGREHLLEPWDEDQGPALAQTDPTPALDHALDLQRALARLTPAAREVLLLVTVEEYSYRETADILDLPIGTVMSRLARAREQLRQRLDPTAPRQAPPSPPLRVVK